MIIYITDWAICLNQFIFWCHFLTSSSIFHILYDSGAYIMKKWWVRFHIIRIFLDRILNELWVGDKSYKWILPISLYCGVFCASRYRVSLISEFLQLLKVHCGLIIADLPWLQSCGLWSLAGSNLRL